MAFIDPRNDTLVIRVVYDGPAMSGKTTSMRALAGGLGGRVATPHESRGRTVYFDWLDYTGGLFEGRRIRCQIVSVPGQAVLAPRRRRLIESADAVVFVCDSAAAAAESAKAYLAGLRRLLDDGAAPVGIVVQANKRDDPQALAIDELRRMVHACAPGAAIVESVATECTGIRECFVLAVRLALDRCRAQMRLGSLPARAPAIDTPQDLLAEIQRAENGALAQAFAGSLAHTRIGDIGSRDAAAQGLRSALRAEFAAPSGVAGRRPRQGGAAPALPAAMLPSGMIWPPVEGRIILHEARSAGASAEQADDGSWGCVAGDRWRFHSATAASYSSLDDGRALLLQWARQHAAARAAISPERCIVLASDRSGAFRLWQIVRDLAPLRARVDKALAGTTEELAKALIAAVRALVQAYQRAAAAACALRVSLDTVGEHAGGGLYVGLMPHPAAMQTAQAAAHLDSILRSELGSARCVPRARVAQVCEALAQHAGAGADLEAEACRSKAMQYLLAQAEGLPQ